MNYEQEQVAKSHPVFLMSVELPKSATGLNYYGHIEFTPVYLHTDGTPRNYSNSFGDEPLDSLTVSAQTSPGDRAGEPYGWQVEYKGIHSADLRELEAMVKMLRKVDRGLKRVSDRYGPPESFGAYVMRVADILGIDKVIRRVGKQTLSYSEGEYQIESIKSALYWTEDATREIKKVYGV